MKTVATVSKLILIAFMAGSVSAETTVVFQDQYTTPTEQDFSCKRVLARNVCRVHHGHYYHHRHHAKTRHAYRHSHYRITVEHYPMHFPCGAVWLPEHYTCYGEWMPGHWESRSCTSHCCHQPISFDTSTADDVE